MKLLNMIYMILVGLDQLLNVVLLGQVDETLSSRLYRKRNEGSWWMFWHNTVNKVFFFQKDHCMQSFLYEFEKRGQFHAENNKLYRSIPAALVKKYSKF